MTAPESEAIGLQRDWIVACEVAREATDDLRLAQARAHAAQAYRRSAYLAYAHAVGWDVDDPWLAAQALLILPNSEFAPDVEDAPPARAGEASGGPSEAVPEVTLGEASVNRCPSEYTATDGSFQCLSFAGHPGDHYAANSAYSPGWTW